MKTRSKTSAKASAAAAPAGLHAVVYARLSHDPDGQKVGINAQVQNCRARAASEGWTVAKVFSDQHRSAWRTSVVREAWDQMIEYLEDNPHVAVVIAWKLDRLARRPKDFIRLNELLDARGGRIVLIADGLDTGTAAGDLTANLLVLVAQMESASTSQRLVNHNRYQAEQGEPFLSGSRGFGHTKDRAGVVDHEAALIREAVDRIVNQRHSIRQITFDWADRGVTTANGKTFAPSSLRRMLLSPRLIGQRDYKGVGYPSTKIAPILVDGNGDPDLALYEDLVGVLKAPERTTTRETRRSYLLTGLVMCASCEGQMVARPRQDGVPRYVCPKLPGREPCGNRSVILAEPLEILVREAAFLYLDGPDFKKALRGRGGSARTMQKLERQRDALQTSYKQRETEFLANPKLPPAYLASLWANTESQLRDIDLKIAALQVKATPGMPVNRDQMRRDWEGANPVWRRDLLKVLINYVAIHPAVRGRNRFDTDRVYIDFK